MAAPVALGRLPWRGEELARPSPSDPTGPRQHEIQAYLIAAAVNLKRPAAALFARILGLLLLMHPLNLMDET